MDPIPDTTPEVVETPAAPTPAPDPTPQDPTPPADPPKEEEGSASDAVRQMLGIEPAPKKARKVKEDPAPVAPVEPKPADPAPVAPAEPKTPVRKRAAAPPPPAAMTAEEVARIAAATVNAHRPPEPASPEVSPADAKKLEIYAEAERLFPDKYPAGSAQRFAKAHLAEVAYAEKWEAANPEKGAFNSNAPEHASWYAKNFPENLPTVSDEDLDEAKFALRYRKMTQQELAPQLDEVRRGTVYAQAEPKARALAEQTPEIAFRAFAPDVKEVTPAAYKAWSDGNPVGSKILERSAQQAQALTYHASLLWDGAAAFDQANPAHAAAAEALTRMESELKGHGEQIKNDFGQTWVPLGDYEKLTPAKRATSFTTTRESLARYITLSEVEKARGFMQELGLDKLTGPKVTPTPTPAPAPTPPPAPSPSLSGGDPTPASKGVVPKSTEDKSSALYRALGIE